MWNFLKIKVAYNWSIKEKSGSTVLSYNGSRGLQMAEVAYNWSIKEKDSKHSIELQWVAWVPNGRYIWRGMRAITTAYKFKWVTKGHVAYKWLRVLLPVIYLVSYNGSRDLQLVDKR